MVLNSNQLAHVLKYLSIRPHSYFISSNKQSSSTLRNHWKREGIVCCPQRVGIKYLAAFSKYGVTDFLYWPISSVAQCNKNFNGSGLITLPCIREIMSANSSQNGRIAGQNHPIWPCVARPPHSLLHKGEFDFYMARSWTGALCHWVRSFWLPTTCVIWVTELCKVNKTL